MTNSIKILFGFILTAAVLDLFVLFATIAQITAGVPTPHIPFWDSQIKVVASVLNH